VDASVDEAMEAALRVFGSEQAARAFLKTSIPILGGGVPLQMIKEGRGAEVLALLERLLRETPPPSLDYWGKISKNWMGGWAKRR
jgi:Protein of unknown function (DUF2384)